MKLAVLVLAVLLLVAAPAAAHEQSRWECIAHWETTHRWKINTGNGYYGGLQFSLRTWRYYGGPAFSGDSHPHEASRREQIHIARRAAWWGYRDRPAQGGANAWPGTWRECR